MPDTRGSSVASDEADTIELAHCQPTPCGRRRPEGEPAPACPPADAKGSKLSAVIVHYNDPKHLLPCVQALRRDPGVEEIIVVDNASAPGALALVTASCHDVQVVSSPVNLGFGGGANLGAARTTGDLLVFLNPDTVPEPGCMATLASHLSEHGGVVGPLVRTGPHGTSEYGYSIDRMLLLRAMEQPAIPLYVSGCCLATTRACFDAVGGFDDRYFLFVEDVEFCWQALRREFPVVVLATAGLAHVGGAAAPGGYLRAGRVETSSSRILLRERNTWALMIACAPARYIPQLIALSILRTVAFSTLFLVYGRPRDAGRLWGGLLWNVANFPTTLERRRRGGVTRRGEHAAWSRVERRFFLWDLLRRGERVRFVDAAMENGL